MIDDYDLAFLCGQSYKPNAVWDNLWTGMGVHVGHRLIDGTDVIVFRGSADLTDWLRDFEGWPDKHPRLGWCHSGFLRYMDLVFEEIMAVIGKEIVLTGHSLGAARASIMTGLLVSHGAKVKARVVFGEPKPGFGQLATLLQQSGCELRSYRNANDPVTEVPVTVPPLLKYQHAAPLTRLNVPGDGSPLGDHSIDLYMKGLQP